MIDNKEIGAALLRVVEVIGPENIEDIDDDTDLFYNQYFKSTKC